MWNGIGTIILKEGAIAKYKLKHIGAILDRALHSLKADAYDETNYLEWDLKIFYS